MKAILTYHSIDDSGSVISTSREVFRRHVAWLASGSVRVVPLETIATLPHDTDAVAVTFDDGAENFASEAVPLLRRHGLPVTLFVSSACVGGANSWGGVGDPGIPMLPLLGWPALLALAADGVTLGAHGRVHRRLAGLGAVAAAEEIVGSGEDIAARTGTMPASFAYPYGSLDDASARLVRATYAWGVTTELRALGTREAPERLPRLDAYYFRNPARLEAWGSPAFRQRLRLRTAARHARAWVTARMGRSA